MRYLFLLPIICCLSCNTGIEDKSVSKDHSVNEIRFDKAKWLHREGQDYPYRDQMIVDIVYNDTIRDLEKGEILDLLGEPDRINENYFYYQVSQKRIGPWPLHTKTLVIKLTDDDSVDWIKIHD